MKGIDLLIAQIICFEYISNQKADALSESITAPFPAFVILILVEIGDSDSKNHESYWFTVIIVTK